MRIYYWLAVRYNAVSCHLAELRGDKVEAAIYRNEVHRIERQIELEDFQRGLV